MFFMSLRPSVDRLSRPKYAPKMDQPSYLPLIKTQIQVILTFSSLHIYQKGVSVIGLPEKGAQCDGRFFFEDLAHPPLVFG